MDPVSACCVQWATTASCTQRRYTGIVHVTHVVDVAIFDHDLMRVVATLGMLYDTPFAASYGSDGRSVLSDHRSERLEGAELSQQVRRKARPAGTTRMRTLPMEEDACAITSPDRR
jgi:hypothetical protein